MAAGWELGVPGLLGPGLRPPHSPLRFKGLGSRIPDSLRLKTDSLPIYSSKKAGTTPKGKVGGRWK